MKIELELDDDHIGEIVRKDLITSYLVGGNLINSGFHDDRDVELQKCLIKIIEMYSTPSQYKEFCQSIGRTN